MKVVEFVKRVDEKDLKITPNEVLEGAANLLECVMIIGVDVEGMAFFSSSLEDKASMIYMLEQLKFDILAGEFDYEE